MTDKYGKRQGTSAIRGQLYETKLISLINFRLTHDDNIKKFILATNVDKIGSFDDICFRFEQWDSKKPSFVFLQAKHKENVKKLYSYKMEMGKNFKSYLSIRYRFDPKQKDLLFQGNFDDTQCYFVMYSNAMNELTELDERSFTDTLDELIGSGGNVKKPFDSVEDVKYLCEIAVKEQINELAGRMVLYINDEIHFSNMMGDDLILRYHVILRQKVLEISEIQTGGYRMATFKPEFFDNNEEVHIILLRDSLYMQLLKKREMKKDDIPKFFSEYFEKPSDPLALSKLIGTIITYKNGQLQLIKPTSSTKAYQLKLREIFVSQLTVNKAMELAAKEILQYTYNKKTKKNEKRQIKVPNSFGNRNLTMKDKERLDHVIKAFGDLLEKFKPNGEGNIVVTLNESSENMKGLLRLNGGISSAVGNVLVLDKDTKLIKCKDNSQNNKGEESEGSTDEDEELEGFAKELFEGLKTRIKDLHKYRFNFEGRKFPKLSFESSLYEVELVKDYLKRLIFFTDQSNEDKVGDLLKKEIENELRNYINNLEVRTDAIYLKYFEEIQAWWMTLKQAPYLTESTKMFGNVTDDIFKDRLMSIITYVTNKKKKKYFDYTFEEDVVLSSKLQEQSQTILIADNCELLFAKVIQHLERENDKKNLSIINNTYDEDADHKSLPPNKNNIEAEDTKQDLSGTNNTHEKNNPKSTVSITKKNYLEYIVLDLENILNLPKKECEGLASELSGINENKILIFVCDKIQNSKEIRTNLENIAKGTENKKKENTKEIINRKIIVIANKISVDVNIIQKHFTRTAKVVNDDRHSIIDMIGTSQNNILANAKIIFQGKEVSLDRIIKDESIKYVQAEVLKCVMNRDKIFIGKPICSTQLDEISHNMYFDRTIKKGENGVDISVETLFDVDDDVILVTAIPGMGKSTLLTNLSIKTKNMNPDAWIIRINLSEYSKEFSDWQKAKNIDIVKSLEFMCGVLLREKLGEKPKVEISLAQENGVVQLTHCTGDHWTEFELKLFLHFYNRRKLIFLFDGFDEICPHYTNEVLEFLKIVKCYPQKHKIWITSRPYDDIKSKLEQQFGESYELSPLSNVDRALYLAKFWISNFDLRKFDSAQLDNVHDFIKYTSGLVQRTDELHGNEPLLHEIYINASVYFICGIKYMHLPLWKHSKDIDMEYFLKDIDYIESYTKISDDTPLNLYMVADYFQSLIKSTRNDGSKWNLDINTFDIYEKYLEMKVKKIWLGEKIKTDVFTPDSIMLYEQKLPELIVKHKKLAAYAIFEQLRKILYNEKELNGEIESISEGKDKVGLICGVNNGVPQFSHLTFTENYAVEYVCDMLKNESNEKQKYWLDFIFNMIFTRGAFANLRSIFDYKVKIDKKLMDVLVENQEFIFDILMKQGKLNLDYIAKLHNDFFEYMQNMSVALNFESLRDEKVGDFWALAAALGEKLTTIVLLFSSILQKYLNKNHVDEFVDMIQQTNALDIARGNGHDDFLIIILDYVRNNSNKLNSLLTWNFNFLPRSTNYEEITSPDIVRQLHNTLFSIYEDLIKRHKKSGL